MIHILSTMTHPCLHYEINEAWLRAGKDLREVDTDADSDVNVAVDVATASSNESKNASSSAVSSSSSSSAFSASSSSPLSSQMLHLESQSAAGGKIVWTAIASDTAGYVLDGTFEAYFPDNLTVHYSATYANGVRLSETLYVTLMLMTHPLRFWFTRKH